MSQVPDLHIGHQMGVSNVVNTRYSPILSKSLTLQGVRPTSRLTHCQSLTRVLDLQG